MYKIMKDELYDNFEIYCFLCHNNEVSTALKERLFDDSIYLSISLENIDEEGDNFILTYLKEGKEHSLTESKEFVLAQGMVNSGKYHKTEENKLSSLPSIKDEPHLDCLIDHPTTAMNIIKM